MKNDPLASHHELVRQTIAFIENHLQDELAVAAIAAESGLSSWHFQRLFHQLVGETIGAYVRGRRLTCSLHDLLNTQLKIIDIAFSYQFESSEAYSRAFKAEYGVSPLQFRKKPIAIVPQRKPPLDHKRLDYVLRDLKLVPEIKTIDGFTLVGLPVSLTSPLAQRAIYLDVITRVWKDFVARENLLETRLGAIKVGVIDAMVAPRQHIHDDQMTYLAATPVRTADVIPEGMVGLKIPGGTYAVFQGKGYHEQTQFLIDHVYSTWLPRSGLRRAGGPEFTWLDHTHEPLDPRRSKVEYFLPIQ